MKIKNRFKRVLLFLKSVVKSVVKPVKKVFKFLKTRLVRRTALGILIVSFAFSTLITSRWLWQHYSQPQEKYAVLISAGQTFKDNQSTHFEYWGDLLLTYKTLIKQGYSPDHIYVFYGKGPGSDFKSKYKHYNHNTYWYDSTIIDYSNKWSDLEKGFEEINSQVTKKDKLKIHWVIGHGGIKYSNPYYSYYGNLSTSDLSQADSYKVYFEYWREDSTIKYPKTSVEKIKVLNLINTIKNYKQREIYWLTCHSGAMIVGLKRLGGARTTIITSSAWNNASYSGCPKTSYTDFGCEGGYRSGEFNWILYGIYNNQYFNGDLYEHYNSEFGRPYTPYKIYKELQNCGVMRAKAQIGGGSPAAVWAKVIDSCNNNINKTKVATKKVEQFFKHVSVWIIDNIIWFGIIAFQLQIVLLYFLCRRRR